MHNESCNSTVDNTHLAIQLLPPQLNKGHGQHPKKLEDQKIAQDEDYSPAGPANILPPPFPAAYHKSIESTLKQFDISTTFSSPTRLMSLLNAIPTKLPL